MVDGNLIGGWAEDRNLRRTVLVGCPVFLAAMAFIGLFGDSPVGAIAVGGANMLLIPAVQTRLIAVSGRRSY